MSGGLGIGRCLGEGRGYGGGWRDGRLWDEGVGEGGPYSPRLRIAWGTQGSMLVFE